MINEIRNLQPDKRLWLQVPQIDGMPKLSELDYVTIFNRAKTLNKKPEFIRTMESKTYLIFR